MRNPSSYTYLFRTTKLRMFPKLPVPHMAANKKGCQYGKGLSRALPPGGGPPNEDTLLERVELKSVPFSDRSEVMLSPSKATSSMLI